MKPLHTTHQKSHKQAQEQTTAQAASTQTATQFPTTEAVIQHDTAQTPVPPAIARRLLESIAVEKPTPRRWWRCIFGG